MTTDYDPIAEQYKRSKLQPWRTHIECFTLLELLGDLSGQSVVDLACGEGFYTRLLRLRGAERVTGIDLSHGMIELARKQEAVSPLGIEYLVGDARDVLLPDKCDIVVAAYLLNYASNRDELAAMCRGIARCLKPGGRFVTVNSSPLLDFFRAPSYRDYGFETAVASECCEGLPITWTFHLDDGSFEIENYFLNQSLHEQMFRDAGFRDVCWHAPRLSPDGVSQHGDDYWKTFLTQPPISFIEASVAT